MKRGITDFAIWTIWETRKDVGRVTSSSSELRPPSGEFWHKMTAEDKKTVKPDQTFPNCILLYMYFIFLPLMGASTQLDDSVDVNQDVNLRQSKFLLWFYFNISFHCWAFLSVSVMWWNRLYLFLLCGLKCVSYRGSSSRCFSRWHWTVGELIPWNLWLKSFNNHWKSVRGELNRGGGYLNNFAQNPNIS